MTTLGVGLATIGLRGGGAASLPPPILTAIGVSYGPSAGGTVVPVTGSNIVTLTFGGIAATNNGNGTWTTGNGANSVGGDVVATDASGSATLHNAWTYLTGQLGGAKAMLGDLLLGDF